MAVKILKDMMGTKYITNEHASKLRSILSSIGNDTIDLCGCFFMPSSERTLRDFYDKVTFQNSADPKLNAILQHNMQAKLPSAQPENIEVLPTGVLTQSEVLELFKTIDKTKVYKLGDVTINPLKKFSLAILLMMKFPEIIFDLEENAAALYKMVRRDWLKYREPHKTYLEIKKMAVIQHDVVNGYVDYPGVGRLREDIFVMKYMVLPIEFGTCMLYGHPEFQEVWDNAVENLCKVMDSSKIMRDYIEIME